MIKLYEFRTERSLTQRAMAKALNISQATYNNWENGKTQPSIEQLIALADFFGESIDDLVGRTGNALGEEFPRYKLLAEFYALDEETQALFKTLFRKLQKK